MSGDVEFLCREKWSEKIKRYTVAHLFWRQTIDFIDLNEREIFFSDFWRTDDTLYAVASLKSE